MGHNRTETARALGIAESTLWRKLRAYVTVRSGTPWPAPRHAGRCPAHVTRSSILEAGRHRG
jgi:hypothetical protein